MYKKFIGTVTVVFAIYKLWQKLKKRIQKTKKGFHMVFLFRLLGFFNREGKGFVM